MVVMQSQYAAAQDAFNPQNNVTGAWSGDGVKCFVREYRNADRQAVTWICENPDQQWSYVFSGLRNESNNTVLEGSIAFIPKGTRVLRRNDVTFRVGRRTSAPRRGADAVTKRAIFPRSGLDDAPFVKFFEFDDARANFTKVTRSSFGPYQDYFPAPGGSQDLTGVWYGNDGGVYYILQRGPFITWFGESSNGAWANVAEGGRIGQNMSLAWADVPKGGARGQGQLGLRLEGSNRLVRTSASGGFGGSVWTREGSTRVVQPEPIGGLGEGSGLCPFDPSRSASEGDREFNGNGPRITTTVNLSIEPRFRRSVRATVNFSAIETSGDSSSVSGSWTRTIYIAPVGKTIAEILSDTSSSFNFVGPGAGAEVAMGGANISEDRFGFSTNEEVRMRALPNTEAVSRLFFVGDTGGSDISSDDSCRRETRIQYIEFNPLRIRLN